jgi:hypothetical protein
MPYVSPLILSTVPVDAPGLSPAVRAIVKAAHQQQAENGKVLCVRER